MFVEPFQALPRQIRNRPGQRWRGVQRLRPLQPDAEFGRILAKQDVHVVENFDVVAEKADGLEDQLFDACGGNASRVASTVGPIHGPPLAPWL